MNNIEFTSKEQIIFFMMTTSISLSHYDYKFISNMQSLTHDKKQVTSGQADLFDKLLHKYRKQFLTNGYDPVELEKLSWKCVVVPSLPKYTNANVDWDDSIDMMTIRVPFKKEFISKFRALISTWFPVDSLHDSAEAWIWNSERKRYEAKPSTYGLKLAYEILPQYFTTVYHNEIKDIIQRLEAQPVKYNDPTLVCVDGHYAVVNSNQVLAKLLEEVTLDNSAKCLYQLSQLGIKIDKPITEGSPQLLFASSYIVECDIDEISEWCSWLVDLGTSDLLMGRGTPAQSHRKGAGWNSIYKECRDNFVEHNLKMHPAQDMFGESDGEYGINGMPVLVQFNSIIEPEQCHGDNRNGKIIIITNGRPIQIT